MSKKYVAIDLDGTLAVDLNEEKFDYRKVGPPIMERINLAKALLAAGIEVRIFTARVSNKDYHTIFDGTVEEFQKAVRKPIIEFCLKYIGEELPITCEKDYQLAYIIDDKAFHAVKNGVEIKW